MLMSFSEQQYRMFKEFNIPVTWGHIAVKAWGSADYPHVLVVHGLTDNAGSFDNLIPLLPLNFYYICIDLPGHGKSSHFPPYLPIYSLSYLIACKQVIDYFKKEKYIFIGHSLGGQLGFYFCKLYPNRIEKFVAIDGAHFFTVETKNAFKYLKAVFDKNENLQQQFKCDKGPACTYNEIAEFISNNRLDGEKLNKEAVEPILKRCLQPTDNGKFYITTDPRVTAAINLIHDGRFAVDLLKFHKFSCPVLVIFAMMNFRIRKTYKVTCEQLFKTENVTVVYVDGKHDVHNNNPKVVAPHITKWLLSLKSKI